MKSKQLRLTRADITKAIFERNQDIERFGVCMSLSTTCPIFQSLKRYGYDPVVCGSTHAVLRDHRELDLHSNAREITGLLSREWEALLKRTLPIYYMVTYVD